MESQCSTSATKKIGFKMSWENLYEKFKRIYLEIQNKKKDLPAIINLQDINLIEILEQSYCEKIFYFQSKNNSFSLLSLGFSRKFDSFSEIKMFINKNKNAYINAPTKFEFSNSTEDLSEMFYLGEWTFIQRNNSTTLIIYPEAKDQKISPPELFFKKEVTFSNDPFIIPPWVNYEERPTQDIWIEMIKEIKNDIKNETLEKVVISRKKIFEYSVPVEPSELFINLHKKNFTQNHCYALFYQQNLKNAFISFTPEKLFSTIDKVFESVSLAASAPRGKTEQEDIEFEHLLNHSHKLIKEHEYVTNEILGNLKPIMENIFIGELKTMKLPYIQHRVIEIKATMNENIGPLDLLSYLHPTPAVGGLPKQKAIEKILLIEGEPRGHYAAPFGYINQHNSEFAVAIRSAHLLNNSLTVFGGAGIVEGSDAIEEWNETGIKMNPFISVVNNV